MDQKDIKDLTDVIDKQEWLTPAAEGVQNAVEQAFKAGGEPGQKLKNILHGTFLGHPLHPAITDVPIGAWTVALTFDAIDVLRGNDDMAEAANAAIGIGLVGAAGAAVTGLADYQGSGEQAPRAGLVHGVLNLVATGLYVASWMARRRGSMGTGRALSLLGYGITSAAAYLGGELVSGQRIGVDHAEREGLPGEWTPVLDKSDLAENEPKKVDANGIQVLLVQQEDKVYAIGEVCSHLGGPLSEGEIKDCGVVCPWHASRFCLETGKVLDGPATFAQPVFETRVREGQIEVRATRSTPDDSE